MNSRKVGKVWRAWLLVWTVLLGCMVTAGQTGVEQKTPPPQPPQTSTQAAPEKKLTAQEAAELFKSADEILQFVSKDTGLPIKHKVDCQLASRDEVVRFVEQKLAEDEDAQRLERSAVSLKKFGLLPRDFELRPYLLSMLEEQVAGFYDPKTKKLYLLDWVDPESQQAVLAHELTHALQDQNFDIEKWAEVSGKPKTDAEIIARDETGSAKQAVIEGQAMITLLDYSLAPMGVSVADAPNIVEAMKQGMINGSGSPIFDKAPMFLRQALIFPYQYGIDFVRGVLVKRGKEAAFAGTMRKPPTNTRQVMMPEKYMAGEALPPMPLANVDKVLGKGWERYDFGGIGQFDVGVLMQQWTGEEPQSKLVSGWRGGYYWTGRRAAEKSGPVAMVFVTRWESPTDASTFANIYSKSLAKRYAKVASTKAFEKDSGEWMTEDGPVRISVQGNVVVGVEGFPEDVAVTAEKAIYKTM